MIPYGQTATGEQRDGLIAGVSAQLSADPASKPRHPTAVQEHMGRIDDWIARRVKQARVERGLSQEALADKLGISLQQIHKYEAGRNRISATRLAAISEALGKPLDEFFEGLDAEATQTSQEPRSPDRGRECLELVRNFEQVNDPEKRRAMVEFLRALGSDKAT